MSLPDDSPYHAHIYFSPEQRRDAEALRSRFQAERDILFVGRMTEGKAGPHPIPQYEVHFLRKSVDRVQELVRASGLRALVHPLTNDDLADHTSLGEWIGGEPLDLDLTTLDPPGMNQGIERFGKTDF
ncbi:MAG TPA: DOPA 4,5-dioxygenase family protein [Sphingomicrobium sp.]|nr:DOPA 4,5-dioxygenase family protein [Sphingomicrobium sp.]